jgi:hypothetical protein
MSAKCPLFHSDLGAKVTKQKDTPAAAHFLRFSLKRAAAELVLSALRQSSPNTPVLTEMYPYWACPPSARSFVTTLAPSARQRGYAVSGILFEPKKLKSECFVTFAYYLIIFC